MHRVEQRADRQHQEALHEGRTHPDPGAEHDLRVLAAHRARRGLDEGHGEEVGKQAEGHAEGGEDDGAQPQGGRRRGRGAASLAPFRGRQATSPAAAATRALPAKLAITRRSPARGASCFAS